ncbi:hypothetical protein ESA94_05140 [Lacibacter luteus]|uniref:Lipocalin-like domain-containing protein n=1 Tax=Lacibacter luteus TaxID=2508719 RepID=A0A4Q1CMX2_9BACT|nr:hypothetical protein [Lacibacter luteus]RXK62396.1 hypothetical protein ESA94_05140 [Lacibacter luteus]
MKQTFILAAFLCLSVQLTFSQTYSSGTLEGEWQFLRSKDEYVKVETNNITIFKKNASGNWEPLNENSNRKKSMILGSKNASVSVIESNSSLRGTTTHSINLFYISPFIAAAHDVFFINRIEQAKFPERSWSWGDSSLSTVGTEWDYMVPRIQKMFKLAGSMASTSKYIKLDTAFNTARYTVLRFTAKNLESTAQNFTLNPPGNEHAFSITDQDGKVYNLLGQYGFGGFNSYSYQPKGAVTFFVFFERIPDDTKRITVREGNCTEGCWNFYDVTLN